MTLIRHFDQQPNQLDERDLHDLCGLLIDFTEGPDETTFTDEEKLFAIDLAQRLGHLKAQRLYHFAVFVTRLVRKTK